ncbi:MAG: hypothetical protein PF513_04870 [Tenericutes bacterium]|jgi:hypothetical protein|nr:hypothetical protein [Mycoplasmatota bacterium]
MKENWGTTFRRGVFDNLGFIMTFLVAIIYLFYGLINLEESGKTLSEIIISSFVIWLVGYSIGQLLTLQGILKGEKEESVINTKEAHAGVIGDIGEDITYLEFFCSDETKNAKRTARASKLSSVGLHYEDFFTINGRVKEEKILIPVSDDEIKEARNKKKRKAIEEAIYIKITPLTVETLTTDNGNQYDPYNYGKNKTEYLKSEAKKTAVAKLVIGLGFGYYAIKLVQSFEWGYLVWTGIQIGIFLLLGAIGLFKAYLFVTDTQRQHRIQKINKLEQFKGSNKQKYIEMAKKEIDVLEKEITEEKTVDVPENINTEETEEGAHNGS